MKKREPKKILRSPRAPNRSLDAYKMLLRVDVDWGSDGIWAIDQPGGQLQGYVPYEKLSLSPELRKRFDFWTEWYTWVFLGRGSNKPNRNSTGTTAGAWRST